MTPEEQFEQTKADWQSNEDWQFADRDAERRYFFLAGMEAEREACAKIADGLYSAAKQEGWYSNLAKQLADIIRQRGEKG